jgi:hypothetical protein
MSYYRAILREDNWDQLNPAKRICRWHDLVFTAPGKLLAKEHAKAVAHGRGMVFCSIHVLNKGHGEKMINRPDPVQPVKTDRP